MLSLASKKLLGLWFRGNQTPVAAAQLLPRLYHERVVDHYNNPRNVGSFDKTDPTVGTGLVGAPACGDVMKLQIKVDDETGKTTDACFKTFGCGSAIASSSVVATTFRRLHNLSKITGPLQYRSFQPDFVPRDPKAKPKKYKYPVFYDPYGPRTPPSDKIIQLAERIAALPTEERVQIGPTLRETLRHPKMQQISVEGLDLGPQGGATTGSTKAEEKKVEKTAFDVKLEKFDASAKIKVIKEVRAFMSLGLKEAKDLVEKVPVLVKQGVTKEEANDIIEKIKAAGGVAVVE